MKLRIAGFLAAVLTTLVLADTTIAGDPSPTLARILKRGEMTVAMSGSQPPLNATDKSGKLIGLEVELAKIDVGHRFSSSRNLLRLGLVGEEGLIHGQADAIIGNTL